MNETSTQVETRPPDPPEVSRSAEHSTASIDRTASNDQLEAQATTADAARTEFAKAEAMRAADQVKEADTVKVDQPELPKTATDVRYGQPVDAETGKPAPLFDGQPTRDQAIQGGLGDCGVVSTLGAVAETRPDAIKNAVHANEDGTYTVTLHEAKFTSPDRTEATGNTIAMTVTSDVPVRTNDPSTSAYADQSENGTAWASVMEKAVAGSTDSGYARLDEGSTPGDRAELLTQLTGEPAVVRQFDQAPGAVEQQLTNDLDAGKPILVGSIGAPAGTELPHNLVQNHAYEVTGVRDGMVQLHNPWGMNQPDPMTVREFLDNTQRHYTTLE